MLDKPQTQRQFATSPDVADLLLGFCLRRPGDRLLDPGCGTGSLLARAARWQKWLATSARDIPANSLWGIELIEAVAATARAELPQATILTQNFFTSSPDAHALFDAVVGNFTYTRDEWAARLNLDAAQQMSFSWLADVGTAPQLIPQALTDQLDPSSDLHAFFILHSAPFLREGGRLGFVVPDGWLNTPDGVSLKQFLLDHFKILAVVEPGVGRWFGSARLGACLLVLEKCSGPNRRAANMIRLARLKRPLSHFLPLPPDDYRRVQRVEGLVTRLLASSDTETPDFSIRVQAQGELSANARWGLLLRAPAVIRQRLEVGDLPALKRWAIIQRGYTTGANRFFYLTPSDVDKWGIEPEFRQPVLKSLRGLARLRLGPADTAHQLLVVPPNASLTETAVADYIAWGEAQGFHLRQTCAARRLWYSLPAQPPAQLVFPKSIWRRHVTPLLDEPMPIDQQLYQIRLAVGVPTLAAAALLNSAWFMLQCELRGRVNFEAGLLWLARNELADIPLPDPRHFTPAQVERLADCFTALAERPSLPVAEELTQPDRQALDAAVFDLLGLNWAQGTAVYTSLQERMRTRLHGA